MNPARIDMVEQAKAGIVHHARECEDALRLAAFASRDPIALQHEGAGMATGLSKLAVYHSDHAWRWVDALSRARAGAAITRIQGGA